MDPRAGQLHGARITMRTSSLLVALAAVLSGCSAEPQPRAPSQPFLSELSATSEVDEATICRALGHAGFHVADVSGGVLVSIYPSPLATLHNVRTGTDLIGRAFSPGQAFVPASQSEDACKVGELRRYVTIALVEQTRAGARIRLGTANAADVEALRRVAREVVDELE